MKDLTVSKHPGVTPLLTIKCPRIDGFEASPLSSCTRCKDFRGSIDDNGVSDGMIDEPKRIRCAFESNYLEGLAAHQRLDSQHVVME